MRTTLLVDVGHVYARNSAKNGWMQTSDGRRSGGLYGTIRSVLMAAKNFKADAVVMCFDSYGGVEQRRGASPEYKANRVRDPETDPLFNVDYPAVAEWSVYAGAYLARCDHREADDVIAHLVSTEPFAQAIIFSGDADMRALLEPTDRVMITPDGKKRYTTYELMEETGLHPKDWQYARAIAGDKSDNLDGVPGIGIKKAAKIVNEHCCGDDRWEQMLAHPKVAPHAELVRRNLMAIEFLPCPELALAGGVGAAKTLDEFYADWEMESLRKPGVSQLDQMGPAA